MNFFIKVVWIFTLSFLFTACSSDNNTTDGLGIDNSAVLKRAKKSIISMQAILKTEGVTKPTDPHLQELADLMTTKMNENPKIHHRHIGVRLLKDFSFEGFEDRNQNSLKENSEKKLFKVEIDFDGKRLISSGSSAGTGYTSMGINNGFLTGMLMQRFSNHQRGAGVASGFFNNRAVQSHASYSDKRTDSLEKTRERSRKSFSGRTSRYIKSARSRAGSGSRFRGK